MEKYKGMTYTVRSDNRLTKKITIKGKSKFIYSDTPQDLYNQFVEMQHKIQQEEVLKTNKYTVSQYSNIWYENYIEPTKLDISTKKMYKNCIRLYIEPTIGAIKLQNLTEFDVTQMINYMTNKGITRRRELALLTIKQILHKAVINDLIKKNVANEVKIIKHVAKEQKPLTNELINLILQMPNELDSSILMMKFIMTTGTRPEEISPIEKKDILFSKKVDICKVVDLDDPNLKIDYYTKNKDCRKIPLLDFIYDDLMNYIKLNNNNLLFPNSRGKLKSRSSFRRDLERFLKVLNKYYEDKMKETDSDFCLTEENKINFTLYQLRHTYACILHKAGIPLKEAQSFTGHKDLKVLLKIYTHLDKEDIEKATTQLNNYFNENFSS